LISFNKQNLQIKAKNVSMKFNLQIAVYRLTGVLPAGPFGAAMVDAWILFSERSTIDVFKP